MKNLLKKYNLKLLSLFQAGPLFLKDQNITNDFLYYSYD